MSGLCGWTGRLAAPHDADAVIRSMSGVLGRFDSTPVAIIQGGSQRLAIAGSARRACTGEAHGFVAAVLGTPVFTDKSLQDLSRAKGAAVALIEAFREHGPRCCERLQSAFTVALIHKQTGETLLAIDRMGVHNLVYSATGDTLIFASSADAIAGHPAARRTPNWQAIYNYVHFHMVPGPATAFHEQQRLLPGQYLLFRDGALTLDHYWRMRFDERHDQPFEELREEFLSILTDSVRTLSAAERTGAFLSGGTDSSTVSGLLGKVTGKPAETFSIGFAEKGYDEMEYARIAARHFATVQHEYYVTPEDIVDAIPRLAAIYDQPFGNSSAVPTYCCARFARESGMSLLLGGDGGDELFGGNERYATQQLFSYYSCLPATLRTRMLEPLARNVPGRRSFPPARLFSRLIELASTPMPDRLDAHNLLVRMGPESVFTGELLEMVNSEGPRCLMRQVYGGTDAASLINRMLAYDFQFTLADSDLPKVMKSCELAGIPVDFPMLDDRLVAFSAKLDPRLKLRGRKLRYFFKEALRGFLPDEIITKSKHGFGLPFGQWMRSHRPLQELVLDSLTKLGKRGFVRGDFVKRLIGTHLAEHPGYYGTMAWVLMMLELWFEHHSDGAATTGAAA